MTSQHVSKAQIKTRREAVKTLRALLDNHTPRKLAFLTVSRTLKAMGMPHSRATIYSWLKEFETSSK